MRGIEIQIRIRKAVWIILSKSLDCKQQKRTAAGKKKKENHPHRLPHNSTWSHETPFEIIEPQFLTIMYFEPEPHYRAENSIGKIGLLLLEELGYWPG